MTELQRTAPTALPERRAERHLGQAWLGGVCSGLAAHLHWPVLALRLGVVLLATTRLFGVVVYLLLWLAMPLATESREAPGLAAARRQGLRLPEAGRTARAELGPVSAAALIGGGLLWLVQASGWGLSPTVFWPAALGSVGLALVWWQADHISGRTIRARRGLGRWFAPFLAHWTVVVWILVGLLCLAASIALTLAAVAGLGEFGRLLLMLALSVVALALAAAPWLLRVRRSLEVAREEKLLADARADMAAHLHDSVLQTLALIQRQASDPKAVASLARRQERELRSWLYGETADETTLRAALDEVAADVENIHGVPVELVTVGDCDLDADLTALVRATREAVVNAAKHSGAPQVDVYAEVDDALVEVFVRDRGQGFDLDAVPEDRLGIRRSIVDRLQRSGGGATIRSAPGEGTEVKLEMRR